MSSSSSPWRRRGRRGVVTSPCFAPADLRWFVKANWLDRHFLMFFFGALKVGIQWVSRHPKLWDTPLLKCHNPGGDYYILLLGRGPTEPIPAVFTTFAEWPRRFVYLAQCDHPNLRSSCRLGPETLASRWVPNKDPEIPVNGGWEVSHEVDGVYWRLAHQTFEATNVAAFIIGLVSENMRDHESS